MQELPPQLIVIVSVSNERICGDVKQSCDRCGIKVLEEVDVKRADLLIFDQEGLEELLGLKDRADIGNLLVLEKEKGKNWDFRGYPYEVLLHPYDEEEFLFRVRAALYRAGRLGGRKLVADGVVLDVENFEVRVDGRVVELTYKEFELLRFLMENRGRVFKREQLLDRLWGYDYYGGTRTVDVHIRRIRAKLDKYAELIETVRGVGYRFAR